MFSAGVPRSLFGSFARSGLPSVLSSPTKPRNPRRPIPIGIAQTVLTSRSQVAANDASTRSPTAVAHERATKVRNPAKLRLARACRLICLPTRPPPCEAIEHQHRLFWALVVENGVQIAHYRSFCWVRHSCSARREGERDLPGSSGSPGGAHASGGFGRPLGPDRWPG